MNAFDGENAQRTLQARAADIIEVLFVPEGLIKKKRPQEIGDAAWAQFEAAYALYVQNKYEESLKAFAALALNEEWKQWPVFAMGNVANIAIALERYEYALKLLSQLHSFQPLTEKLLWNFAYTHYRLKNLGEALNLLQQWAKSVNPNAKAIRNGAGEMVIACLSALLGKEQTALEFLKSAAGRNPALLQEHLALQAAPAQHIPQPAAEQKTVLSEAAEIPAEIRESIIQMLAPKRPERSPALSQFLTAVEMEQYSLALESIADGEYNRALDHLLRLQSAHPGAWLLDIAVAGARIFNGEYEVARDLLMGAVQAGHKISGSAWWNLASAQSRLGDFEGALFALTSCAETEYRSSPQLWKALKALGGNGEPAETDTVQEESSVPKKISHPLLYDLPEDMNSQRIEILNRILRPKKMPKAFKPDLGRLSQRDKQHVAIILDAAYRATSSEASKILQSILHQYPDLYTLKAHLAGHLIQDGNYQQARSILQQAENLRPLDTISRINLAHIYLTTKRMDRVVQVLEVGSDSIKEYTYWLALALARELSGKGDAPVAAARARALAKSGPSEKTVIEVLKMSNIQIAAEAFLENPSLAAAQEALSGLEEGDIEKVRQILEDSGEFTAERIPEINRKVMEPLFLVNPGGGPRWKEDVISRFNAGLRAYEDGKFTEAANNFYTLYRNTHLYSIAVNASAAYLKDGNLSKAKKTAQLALKDIRDKRKMQSWTWRLAYNWALAHLETKDVQGAVKTIQYYRNYGRDKSRSLTGLLAAICLDNPGLDGLNEKLATSLDDLKGLVYKPSDDLILALAWAQLNLPNPNIHDVKQALRELAQPDTKELQPAAEVKSMLQVRTAFESLTAAGEINKAVNYMETIVETRNRERQSKIALDLSNHEVGQSIGLEFIARICLVQALHLLNDRVGAIEELAEIETLLRDNDQFLAPGFLVQNWKELALTAEKIGLLNAAFKYVESGLVIEPENSDLLAYKERLSETLLQQDKDGLMQGLSGLGEKIRSGESAAEIRKVSDTLRPFAPNLMEVFSTLAMNMDDDADKAPVEDMLDQVNFLARMELPAEACREVERLLDWIIINKGWDAVRIPVEIDVYGEQIWPRMDNNQEGTCLLAFSSRQEIENVVLKDPTTEKEIWSGALQPNDVQYKRWTFFREDGFSSDIPLDLPLLLYARDTSGERTYPTAVNVLVGSGEPIWPTYPTGALSPEDVHGAELYGRAYLISRIIRSLGRHRAQSTFFLQGPRQMGKTSLLNFAINQAPAHVLPVYVNLEKQWSSKEPGNIWNYLVNRVQEESSGKAVSPAVSGNDEASLINMVAETCERQQKDYVLFLIDELHFLFEKCDNPSNVLASFRDFLNIRDNRIALLLSDRYTRDELEKRCPSEYWAQLTLLEVGPLDAESTSRAIEYPTRGTDITFLPKTIQQLFHLTGGYPYHLQRAAQYILDNMYSGPWLTALPEDVEEIITHFLEQDLLFQSGLCRPDRIDDELAEAIAALLEWIDLQELLPVLADSDSEWGKSLMRWNPTAGSFLAHMRNPERIITRLRNIGVMKEREDAFFSPLLQMWLQKMRRQSRGLRGDKDTAQWQFISESDGGNLSGRDWQRLDSELIKRAAYKGKPPLKEKNTHIDDWETMTRKVSSEADFRMFVDAAFRLIVDKREERSSIQKYPWLFLAYHRLRLVRNYIAHESETRSALNAWNETCRRALGGNRSAYMPATPDEWQALQLTMLRSLYAGMNNALEIASKAE